MTEKSQVLILGYGEMGHAIEVLLADRHRVVVWDKNPIADRKSVNLEGVLPITDFVLFCLPVSPHREVLGRIKDFLKPGCLCLSIAKGLDETGTCAAQIFKENLPADTYAVIYGPMIAEEIRQYKPAFAQVGCSNPQIFQTIRELYYGSSLFLDYSTDTIGISWSVILKNVYALVFGLSDGLGLGKNTRGFLAVKALNELNRIVTLMGGKTGSAINLAGLGDLITTATSQDSHHYQLGRKLAQGDNQNISGEGIHTLKMIKQHQLFDIKSLPLMYLIDSIVENAEHAEGRFNAYLAEAFDE